MPLFQTNFYQNLSAQLSRPIHHHHLQKLHSDQSVIWASGCPSISAFPLADHFSSSSASSLSLTFWSGENGDGASGTAAKVLTLYSNVFVLHWTLGPRLADQLENSFLPEIQSDYVQTNLVICKHTSTTCTFTIFLVHFPVHLFLVSVRHLLPTVHRKDCFFFKRT